MISDAATTNVRRMIGGSTCAGHITQSTVRRKILGECRFQVRRATLVLAREIRQTFERYQDDRRQHLRGPREASGEVTLRNFLARSPPWKACTMGGALIPASTWSRYPVSSYCIAYGSTLRNAGIRLTSEMLRPPLPRKVSSGNFGVKSGCNCVPEGSESNKVR